MGLHYLVVYVCSAAAASYTANPLPTYHSVILLFTNPGERENLFEECVFVYVWGHTQSCLAQGRMCVCFCMSILPREMIIYLQMPPTKSHDPFAVGAG